MPSVPAGEEKYVQMTGGTTAAMVAEGASHDSGAATFSATTITPTRGTARYTWSYEQEARLPNLESILARDIRQVVANAMDAQVVNGDGASPNLSGYINHATAATATPSAVSKLEAFDGYFAEMVDGLYAYDDADVRMLLGWKTWELLRKTRLTTGDQPTLLSLLPGEQMRASNYVGAPARVNSQDNIQSLYMHRASEMIAVAPVWQGVRAIRDEISKAKEGEVALTLYFLFGFDIVRGAPVERRVKVA